MSALLKPINADPRSIREAQKAAPVFGAHIRDLMLRGWRIRDAVVKALQAAGMYELVKERNPGAVDRIVAWFEAEKLRLEEARDLGHQVVRGVVIEKVDAEPEDVASGRAFGVEDETAASGGISSDGTVRLV